MKLSAALLKRFLLHGQNTFDQIDNYLATARLHQTGRQLVDNFIIPTLLIHQFERSEREGDTYLKRLTLERMMKYFIVAGHVSVGDKRTQCRGSESRPCVSTSRGILRCLG